MTDLDRPATVEVHHPQPIPPPPTAAPLMPVQPGPAPAVQTIQLPDGRIVTGYTLTPTLAPAEARPAVSRTAVNIALGGIGFGAVCGGLFLLTTFIAALAAFVQQLVIFAAVIFGGFIAMQVLGTSRGRSGGTTVHIRKAVIKRNHFRG